MEDTGSEGDEEGQANDEGGQQSWIVHRWPNGDIYNGFLSEGLMHGYGKLTWANGDVYEGNWIEGRMEGKGKKTKLETGVVEEGSYIDGVLDGPVKRVLLRSGDKFEGDDINGFGEYIWAADYYKYIGMWFDGKMHGAGQLFPISPENFSADKAVCDKLRSTSSPQQISDRSYGGDPRWIKSYRGTFAKGEKCGYGVGVMFDGSEYSGEWDHDLFHGDGRIKYSHIGPNSFSCVEIRHPCFFSPSIEIEGLQELKRCSKINIIMRGNFVSGLVHGRGSISQNVAKMPFRAEGHLDGNKRGLQFLLSVAPDVQTNYLNGLLAFDAQTLIAKLQEEDDDDDPPGSGGVYWSVYQLASFFHGFAYEGTFEMNEASGPGLMFNLFDPTIQVSVARVSGRWKVIFDDD